MLRFLIAMALMFPAAAAVAQPQLPAWWATLTPAEQAACKAQGGCALVTVARMVEIVTEETAKLAAEQQEKTCKKGVSL